MDNYMLSSFFRYLRSRSDLVYFSNVGDSDGVYHVVPSSGSDVSDIEDCFRDLLIEFQVVSGLYICKHIHFLQLDTDTQTLWFTFR